MRRRSLVQALLLSAIPRQSCLEQRCSAVCSRRSFAALPETLYEVLGVKSTASKPVIKAAFRKKARELHPDVRGNVHHTAFVSLLQAYEVLVDDQKRQLYDLSIHSQAGRFAKEASLGEDKYREQDGSEQGEWTQGSGGWRAWVSNSAKHPKREARNEIDHLREELRGDFRSALRHAFLGPRLSVGEHELPEAFEAEERSVPGLGDLLHLVSGRALLGTVRERHAQNLGSAAQRAAHIGADSSSDTQPQLGRHQESSAGMAGEPEKVASLGFRGAMGGLRASPGHGRPSASMQPDNCTMTEHPPEVHRQADGEAESMEDGQSQSDTGPGRLGGSRESADVLDLFVDDILIATAVRGRTDGLDSASYESQQAGRNTPQGKAEAIEARKAARRIAIYRDGGPALCTIDQSGRIVTAAELPGSAHHRMITSATPFVRSLHFLVHTGKSKTVMCRCKRAWLPPSATWLFPPRCATHTIGGWYMEWGGYKHRDHPLWLDPAVFVLAAAYDTLDVERARASEAAALKRKGKVDWSAAEDLSVSPWNPKQWARLFLGFHGWPRRQR